MPRTVTELAEEIKASKQRIEVLRSDINNPESMQRRLQYLKAQREKIDREIASIHNVMENGRDMLRLALASHDELCRKHKETKHRRNIERLLKLAHELNNGNS